MAVPLSVVSRSACRSGGDPCGQRRRGLRQRADGRDRARHHAEEIPRRRMGGRARKARQCAVANRGRYRRPPPSPRIRRTGKTWDPGPPAARLSCVRSCGAPGVMRRGAEVRADAGGTAGHGERLHGGERPRRRRARPRRGPRARADGPPPTSNAASSGCGRRHGARPARLPGGCRALPASSRRGRTSAPRSASWTARRRRWRRSSAHSPSIPPTIRS